jgi:hypothetical protein
MRAVIRAETHGLAGTRLPRVGFGVAPKLLQLMCSRFGQMKFCSDRCLFESSVDRCQ